MGFLWRIFFSDIDYSDWEDVDREFRENWDKKEVTDR